MELRGEDGAQQVLERGPPHRGVESVRRGTQFFEEVQEDCEDPADSFREDLDEATDDHCFADKDIPVVQALELLRGPAHDLMQFCDDAYAERSSAGNVLADLLGCSLWSRIKKCFVSVIVILQ